jgi:hypothetical protein
VKPMKIFLPAGGLAVGIAAVVAAVEVGLWAVGKGFARPIEHVNLVMGLGLFGIQLLFLGLIAELILMTRER